MSLLSSEPALFSPFLDSIDMVMCCSSDLPVGVINEQAVGHQLRFPLLCDRDRSLRDHLAGVDHAPFSARFGPYVDNVLGMNWELSTGRIIKVGERVIKSTTGYDLLRFLLHSDGRYGRPRECVLRLRPLGGETILGQFHGIRAAVGLAREALLNSPWIHWIDGIDWVVSADGSETLAVTVDCASAERGVFLDFFRTISDENGAHFSELGTDSLGSLPQLSVKMTPTAALTTARKLVDTWGGAARVLCRSGVVHYFARSGKEAVAGSSVRELLGSFESEGGHVCGDWAPWQEPDVSEMAWASALEAVWNQI